MRGIKQNLTPYNPAPHTWEGIASKTPESMAVEAAAFGVAAAAVLAGTVASTALATVAEMAAAAKVGACMTGANTEAASSAGCGAVDGGRSSGPRLGQLSFTAANLATMTATAGSKVPAKSNTARLWDICVCGRVHVRTHPLIPV